VAYRALVVFDHPDIHIAKLSEKLARCGFQVRRAGDIDTAIRLLASEPFDVAIVPAVDAGGIDLCRSLRSLCAEPIVAVGEGRDEALVVRCLQAGADIVLDQSMSGREFAARLIALLRDDRGSPRIVSPGPAMSRRGAGGQPAFVSTERS